MFFDQVVAHDRNASAEAAKSSACDSATLALLYRQYHDSVLRFCRRALGKNGTDDDAAELVQDAFYRLARKPDPETIENPRAFLFRTVGNLVKDRRRDQYNRAELAHIDISGVSEVELISSDASPEKVAEGRQDLAVLRVALAELSPKCQAVFALRMFRGLSYKEIASEMGVSTDRVKQQLRKAVAHLTARLAEQDRPTKASRPAGRANNGQV